MTAIFYDKKKKLVVCDSQATDYVTNQAVHFEAKKFAVSKDFISITAGNSAICDTYNAFIESGKVDDLEVAKQYLDQQKDEDLQAIVVHIKTGHIAGNLSNGWFRKGCDTVVYGGTGGDILRHNYIVNEQNLDIAYDITTRDRYTYTGGVKRFFNLETGEHNMNEETNVVVQQEAANDSTAQALNYPVGEKSFDAQCVTSNEHDGVFDFQALLEM